MRYAAPGTEGAICGYDARYDNFVDGDWVAPAAGEYFDDPSPVDGKVFTQVARSSAADVERALDAAHTAARGWARTSSTERARVLEQIADRLEANLEQLAVLEAWENGKPVRETLAADLPLAIDHFRYFAAAIRTQEGSSSTIDHQTVAYHCQEPLGVIGQIIPWNFPILMASWQLAPALAAGNCVVLKPAEQTPASILEVMKLVADLLPPGVLNVVNGFGAEAGRALESSIRIAGAVLPVALGLGAKNPNVFFADVMEQEDEFLDKALEGFAMFCLNQGEVGTCPSRALIAESIYEEFIDRAVDRVAGIKTGNPLDSTVMIGAQSSREQLDNVLSYLEVGKAEGADLLVGGDRRAEPGLEDGYYVEPTVFRGKNDMRIFQEEIFGPVVAVTTFADEEDALTIANQTPYGLGAGVWTRDNGTAYRMGRDLQAARVWTNCYHLYPAPAATGGHKPSGLGIDNHQPTLDNYQQTRNILISYDPKPTGLF